MINQRHLLLLAAIILLLVSNRSFAQNETLPFTFKLKKEALTSAGVYKKDGTLIRTLWSGKKYSAGSHTLAWDRFDDDEKVSTEKDVTIKVLSNNVTYQWEGGVIGNTSSALSGSSKYHMFEPICAMAAVGNYMYCATNYNEGYPSQLKFKLSDPQKKEWVTGKSIQGSQNVVTDGNFLYWSIYDPFEVTKTLVFATRANSDTEVSFSAGSNQMLRYGTSFTSAISFMNTGNSIISAMAVQKDKDFLFVARAGLSQLQVLNKKSGTLIKNLTLENVAKLAVDGSDNLWISLPGKVIKYSVSSNGDLQPMGVEIVLTGNVGGLAVSPDNKTLVLLDMETQQVKAFDNANGILQWTLGKPGGYLSDATVNNDKFYFRDPRHPDGYGVYIAFQEDGSFWVGDGGNFRHQHYSASQQYIESIMSLPAVYNTTVDPNNPTRLIANVIEFEIDYSKPLVANNGSWTLKNNWGGTMPSDYDDFNKITDVVTLKNGRTYAFLQRNSSYFVVELVAGGVLRHTGITLGQRTVIAKDGAKLTNPEGFGLGVVSRVLKYPLTGFDANNNPLWSTTPVIEAVTPPLNQNDPFPTQYFHETISASENIVYFDRDTKTGLDGKEYHLGAIKKGTNQWLWKTAKGTVNDYIGDFPADGAFDNGNGVNFYSGGIALVHDDNVFWGYHGEFWKQSQVNKWNHIDANTGLFVNQFGVTGKDFLQSTEAPPEMAGNVFTGGVVTVDGETFLYHNDESAHGGVHRWRISGLNTIEIQEAVIPASDPLDEEPEINLMSGLPRTGDLENQNGWNRGTEKRDYNWYVVTGAKSYNVFAPVDIYARYYQPSGPSSTRSVTRDLGINSNASFWKLTGKISWEGSRPNLDNNIQFVEVLDKNARVITRLQMYITFSGDPKPFKFYGNRGVLFEGQNESIVHGMKFQPFEMSFAEGKLKISYGDFPPVYTTSPMENGADINNPATFRLLFHCGNSFPEEKAVSIAELKFMGPPQVKIENKYRTKASGLWNDVKIWQSSADGTTWEDATLVPDSSANDVSIMQSHTVAINSEIVVDQLVVNKGAELQIAYNGAIYVNNGVGNDITIDPLGKLTIQSNERGTGRIGKSTGNIMGNVTVERYISAKVGYRLLAPSVNTKSSINANWQEGVNNASATGNINPNPGYGTHITGAVNGSNGFDATASGQGSLFTFSSVSIPPTWMLVQNTNVDTLSAKKGYLVNIRGDRSIDLNQKNVPATSTTLRATGSVLTGTIVYDTLKGKGVNNVLANPYPSPISWVKMQKANSNTFENYFTVWDPNVGTRGGYVTVDASGSKSVKTSTINTEIQTGQAFIVKAKSDVDAPSFIINEDDKLTTVNLSGFRPATGPVAKLYTSLYLNAGNSVRNLADGVLSRFNEEYQIGVDGDDAEDLANFDENISLQRNGSSLSIESRPITLANDTLYLKMSNMQQQGYEWQFDAADFNLSTTNGAFFKDRYLGIEVPVNLVGTTVIPFEVTNDPASGNANRFYVVFEQLKTLPVDLLSLKAFKNETSVAVNWTVASEVNVDRYEVERSIDGSQFSKLGLVKAAGSANATNAYSFTDRQPLGGFNYYKLKMIDKDGSFKFSQVVRVMFDQRQATATVYPNPVKGNNMSVSINQLLAGTYSINLTNIAGQTIQSLKVDHAGGVFNRTINAAALPSGKYQLQIIGNGIPITLPVIKL
ncbi:MAG: T9SS type A sorting domain-containing protein [Ferruginibacter sp.]|nr:T9SS type A sorting domain-containing protein [Ferruginibacter sp.]